MKRVALVIGNAGYEEKPLSNPRHDALDMASALASSGFEVFDCIDGTYHEMDVALRDFRAELHRADVGLFFFAGHGIQIEGKNYLLALDTCMDSELDAKHTAMNLDFVIECMERAHTATNLIILDACRDNPWERRWERSAGTTGLASIYAPRGTLIAFATSPGQTASDGRGQRNGRYTAALLQHIDAPDCTIEAMFKRVRNTLSVATEGKQISWEHTSLATEFFFNLSTGARIDTYSVPSLRDGLLELDVTRSSHEMIRGLKVYTWSVQNAALAHFNVADARGFSKNNLFVIGRNIYQAACGGAHAALGFIDDFSAKTRGLTPDKKKAILDGALFEIFFDSDGNLRQDFKSDQFNKVFKLQKYKSTAASFEFISECLVPHSHRFYALPGKEVDVSVDVVLILEESQNSPTVRRICIASENLLRPEDDEEEDENDEPSRFRPRSRDDFEERISQQLMIPLRLLSFTYSGTKKKPSAVRQPLGWTVRKSAM
ncbi:caspase family protein [Pseudomonas sp. JL3]|uniref:caspase family protein n=1 Tax=Pseudomonas sp. JL3 TaxID=2919943 RepID=UPI00285B6DFD|nr:caspase family protein [Pseudomonas sp. JL3]MDR8365037.1 caspase family protein [Pseudomonas sp. JL3]